MESIWRIGGYGMISDDWLRRIVWLGMVVLTIGVWWSEINADVIIEALTDIIHDTEGNDGMDFTEQYDDAHYENFENVDFTALEIN